MTWHISAAQRRIDAKKAALTRKRKGEKPFGGKHGKGGWGHMTPAERVKAAAKARATKLARHEKVW